MQCGYFVAELVYKIIYSHPQWCLELQKNQNISIYCIQFFSKFGAGKSIFQFIRVKLCHFSANHSAATEIIVLSMF
jgi:hypothetical protein